MTAGGSITMAVVEVFGKDGCAKCKAAKDKLTHYVTKQSLQQEVDLIFYDVETVDGMAESAFKDVHEIPTTIVTRNEDVIARWEGCVPPTTEFAQSVVPVA